MISYRGGQRRKDIRERLPTKYPVDFDYQGQEYYALLENLSKNGAGMRSANPQSNPELQMGDEINFNVMLTFGVSKFTGTIAWTETVEDTACWGVEFTKLSDDENDPLRRLISSITGES